MASFDAGYSVVQIVEHAGQLEADGTLPGVDAEGAPLGLFSPLATEGAGASLLGMTAAPRRISTALLAGPIPVDQQVAFADALLGDLYDAGQSRLEAEDFFGSGAPEPLVEHVTEVTLLLAASGYSAEQIVEALITYTWVPGGSFFKCPVILTTLDAATWRVVRPQAEPDFMCSAMRGLLADDPTATTTTITTTTITTTPPPGGQTGGEIGAYDGTYTGSVLLIDSATILAEVLDGVAEITITGGVVEIGVVATLKRLLDFDPGDDEPACVLIDQMTLSGAGTVSDGLVEATLVIDEYLHIDTSEGCTRGPTTLVGVTVPLAGEIADGSLVAFFYGELMIEASRS